jgi:hypothetical protein
LSFKSVNSSRRERRDAAKVTADRLIASGQHAKAAHILQKATEVTWDMVIDVIQVLFIVYSSQLIVFV